MFFGVRLIKLNFLEINYRLSMKDVFISFIGVGFCNRFVFRREVGWFFSCLKLSGFF